jgi:hypothetical protein
MAFTRDPLSGALQSNTFATGAKRYGVGLTAAATSGALSTDGYSERERKNRERRRALQQRLMQQSGQYPGPQGGQQ